MMQVDADNLAYLRPLLMSKGFSTYSAVGADGLDAAWLLVQHADNAPDLQAKILTELEARHGHDSPRSDELAKFKDRVLDNTGRPQMFATQMEDVSGKWQVKPYQGTMEAMEGKRASAG